MVVEEQSFWHENASFFASVIASWGAHIHTLGDVDLDKWANPPKHFVKPELLPRFANNGFKWGATVHGVFQLANILYEWKSSNKTALHAATEGLSNALIGTVSTTVGTGIGGLLLSKAPLPLFFSLTISSLFATGAVALVLLPLLAHDHPPSFDHFSLILSCLGNAILAGATLYLLRPRVANIPASALVTGSCASGIIDKALHHGLDLFLPSQAE